MKKPMKPTRPVLPTAPLKPSPTKTETKNISVSFSSYDTLGSLLRSLESQGVTDNYDAIVLELGTNDSYGEAASKATGSFPISVSDSQYEAKNKKYEEDLAKYNAKLNEHVKLLEQYRIDMMAYQAELLNQSIEEEKAQILLKGAKANS